MGNDNKLPSSHERGVMNARIFLICRLSLAFGFFYQGLVPKLLGPHPDELAMSLALGFSRELSTLMSYAAGVGEVCFGIAFLLWPRIKALYQITLVLMLGLLLYVAWAVPALLIAPFNPIVMNSAMAALAYIALSILQAEHSPKS